LVPFSEKINPGNLLTGLGADRAWLWPLPGAIDVGAGSGPPPLVHLDDRGSLDPVPEGHGGGFAPETFELGKAGKEELNAT